MQYLVTEELINPGPLLPLISLLGSCANGYFLLWILL